MALTAFDDVFHVAFGYTIFGQQCYNTFGFRVLEVPVPVFDDAVMADLGADAVGSWANLLKAELKPLQGDEVNYNKVIVTKVRPVGTLPIEFAHGDNGTHLSDLFRPNTALSISRSGDGPAQRRAGRIQIGGIPDNQATNGLWDAGIMNLAEDVGELMIGEFTGANTNVLMRVGFWREEFTKEDGTVLPARFQDCTRYVVRRTSRTQRTRTIGNGI